MVAKSVLGLHWCQHVGWMVVLYDAETGRRPQVTVPAEDAVVVGRELARQPSERPGLYTLVAALLRQQPRLASISLDLVEQNRARACLVVRGDAEPAAYPTSAGDGVALVVRAGLPIHADEALLATYGIPDDSTAPAAPERGESATPIPPAFRLAGDGAPGAGAV